MDSVALEAKNRCIFTTDSTPEDPRTRAIFIWTWGLKLGVIRFYLVIKITAVFQVHVSLHLLRSKRENKTWVKRCMVRKYRRRIDFSFVFAYVVGKNPKTPKVNPMAENAITRGGIGSLGSLVNFDARICPCVFSAMDASASVCTHCWHQCAQSSTESTIYCYKDNLGCTLNTKWAVYGYLVCGCCCSEIHQRLDGSWLNFYPHLINEIGLLVFKKICALAKDACVSYSICLI